MVEGRGTARVEGREFPLDERDLLVVPSWHALELRADSRLVLFGYSDRAAQEKLRLFREERRRRLSAPAAPPPAREPGSAPAFAPQPDCE